MTSIRIPLDVVASPETALPELPPLPIGALVVGASELLQQAADLPSPVYVTVHDTQAISVLFDEHPASKLAITRWARRFGSVVTSYPDEEQPDTWTWYRADFSYYGIAVTIFTKIPAAPATT
jgi:hypothetical protein